MKRKSGFEVIWLELATGGTSAASLLLKPTCLKFKLGAEFEEEGADGVKV